MATILNIETSTNVCSTALTSDGMILCHREEFRAQNHATLLSDFIKESLDHARDHELKIDAIAVSIGPGSYTGLRIGLSEAKGLAYALNVPLIGVDTLKIMAVNVMFKQDLQGDELFVPMIDARRMEVYTAVYDLALNEIQPPHPLILQPDSFASLAPSPLLIFGNGSDKYRASFLIPASQPGNSDGASGSTADAPLNSEGCDVANGCATTGIPAGMRFIEGVDPLAVDMLPLAEQAYLKRDFLDLAYSVPAYLKEFQATKPKSLF